LLREAGIHGVRQELRVAEGVGHPERRDQVLVVAGVADERPAAAVGTAVEVGERTGAAIGDFRQFTHQSPSAYQALKLPHSGGVVGD
jgi:hypothetical protein